MQKFSRVLIASLTLLLGTAAQATIISIDNCTGATSCTVTTSPPNPISQDPNDGVLLAWNEVQNFTLTEDLRVDRVFDPNASFIESAGGGDFFIKAGTVVSSHYLQWDPSGTFGSVSADIILDSQVFAFITADANLFNSDDALGLAGLDYADFGLRGLESGDVTDFNGANTSINWTASSPGDWTRLITAFSPSAVPEPSAAFILMFGILGLVAKQSDKKFYKIKTLKI